MVLGIDCGTGNPILSPPAERGASVGPAGSGHRLGRCVAIMQPNSRIESEILSPPAAIRRSLGRYRGQPLGIRGFVLARHLLAPLARVVAAVPSAGRILDVGCGHGLFTNALALGSPDRQVLGVDPSPVKIGVARASAAGLPNVEYRTGLVQEIEERGFDGISILDVLYLLPVEDKLAVLQACRERIAPDGVLVLKTNDTAPAWK